MNVRINSDFTIFANTFLHHQLQANRYDITVAFVTNSEKPDHYTVAMDRAVYFIQSVCDNAIFVDEPGIEAYPELDNMGCDVIVLPEEPSDQIIGLMLFCKLNAIMEGKIQVIDVSVKSHVGGNYEYLHNEQELIGPFEEQGWWHESTGSIRDVSTMSDEKLEIYLETLPQWDVLGLEWDQFNPDEAASEKPKSSSREKTTSEDGEVVFVDFGNNSNKPVE